MVQRCVTEGSRYLQCISFDYLITAALFCINGLAIGAGQTMFSLFNGMISSLLLLRIPAAWVLGIALGFGLTRVGSPPRSPREVR